MTLIFRDGRQADNFKDSDLILLNRDKETVVDLMGELEFEERVAIITELQNTDPVQSNLNYVNVRSEPCVTFFGNHCIEEINNYTSYKFKISIETGVVI